MENWIQEQSMRNTSAFDAAMPVHYPEARSYTSDADLYFERVCEQCNYLDAVKKLDWAQAIPFGAKVLDLAGGTGWLSAYLSSLPNVDKITIIDASRAYLEVNLPVSIRRLNGVHSKITPVVGYFSPLILEDASIDVVVVSSSLHHADNLEAVLKEIYRVLVPGGKCFILNETPVSDLFYIRTMITTFIRTMLLTVTRRYVATSLSISASGILCDPFLGDRMFPSWYWRSAILQSGFALDKVVNTDLSTVKDSKGISLVHFICSKSLA
jgi:SAM-dependent methyltransferase